MEEVPLVVLISTNKPAELFWSSNEPGILRMVRRTVVATSGLSDTPKVNCSPKILYAVAFVVKRRRPSKRIARFALVLLVTPGMVVCSTVGQSASVVTDSGMHVTVVPLYPPFSIVLAVAFSKLMSRLGSNASRALPFMLMISPLLAALGLQPRTFSRRSAIPSPSASALSGSEPTQVVNGSPD